MTTQEIASRLVELCRKGDFETAQEELYAADAISVEPYATPEFKKETTGKEAIKEKGNTWASMVQEMKGIEVSEPLVAGNVFACTIRMHVVMKQGGEMDMTELCMYKVKDGKVISEEFFV